MQLSTTQSGEGFVYCYNSLYRLLFYGGVITFRLHNLHQGGPKSSPLRVIYALSARFFLLGGFISGVYIKSSDAQMSQAMFSHLSPVVKIIFSWECLSCIITYLQYCGTLDSHRSQHIKLLTGMQKLDTEISAEFPYVSWRYERTRSKYWNGTVGITLAYILLTLVLMFDTTRCSCGFVSTVLIASTYSLLTSTLGVMGFIHIGLMDYLRLRFRLIMKLLRQLYRVAEAEGETDRSQQLQQDICKLFDFSKRCSHLLVEMNGVCAYVAASGMFYDFTHMTGFVYVLCQKVLRSEPWDTQYAFISLHLVVHIYKVIMTSVYGYLLKREKRNCMRLLSEYAVHFGNKPPMRSLVECFQHWRIHNNQSASIASSFPCNISMIYVIFNGLANYVIVLVQLLFQLQIKDMQGQAILVPKDVELIKPIGQTTHMIKQ